MQRAGAYILGLLFSGGTVLAAGSVLSSLKRSISALTSTYPVARREVPLGANDERERSAVPGLLALAQPQTPSEEILQITRSHENDISRPGTNRKKRRRQSPAKGRKTKSATALRATSHKKREGQP
jgi:hypothetical protein